MLGLVTDIEKGLNVKFIVAIKTNGLTECGVMLTSQDAKMRWNMGHLRLAMELAVRLVKKVINSIY